MSEMLKEDFLQRFKYILGEDFSTFIDSLSKPAPPSIRVNTLKISGTRLRRRLRDKEFRITSLPWYGDGLRVSEPTVGLGKTAEHALGYYYIQGAASMLPPLALNPCPHERVLDLCAAPGSKTTQIAQMMRNKGVIVANDLNRDRLRALNGNLQRCGVSNSLVTNMDGASFSDHVKQRFDRVLVDAPCSGSGLIRNQPEIGRMWSVSTVRGLSGIQRRIIMSGFNSLVEGGFLVYSTCSLDPEENEAVVDHLLSERADCEIADINLKDVKVRGGLRTWEGARYQEELSRCIRIYPQDNDTIGFFLAKVRRVEG